MKPTPPPTHTKKKKKKKKKREKRKRKKRKKESGWSQKKNGLRGVCTFREVGGGYKTINNQLVGTEGGLAM